MKAEEVLKLGFSFLGEKPQPDDLSKFSLLWLNLLLKEALPYENACRRAAGREALSEPPVITDWAQELPYEARICGVALPYGLAEYLYAEDGDAYNAEKYRARFRAALNEGPAAPADIEDVYGGDENG